jgi:ferredoxin
VIDRIHDGLASARPALFSVFTGSTEHVPTVAPYLVAAAAVQSRAVPTFSFDPDAGPGWADRFDLGGNPAVDDVWPPGTVSFEDPEMQRRVEPAAFTLVDFAALDRRYGRHFATAPPNTWNGEMRPVDELVDVVRAGHAGPEQRVPYLLMTTADDVLHRVVVDRDLMRTAHHFGETWRSLQELAGIHNSHALALLAAERAKWDEQRAGELINDTVSITPSASPGVDAEARTAVPGPPEPVPAGDEQSEGPAKEAPPEGPYIETVRCTTCDECTNLNPRMFAYDENKQAYITDLSAGTYREMVEATEACQVAIIHPGLPWGPSEPGLDDLIARAAAFT